MNRKRTFAHSEEHNEQVQVPVCSTSCTSMKGQKEQSKIGLFMNKCIRIVPAAIGKSRLKLFETLVTRHGGRLLTNDTTWRGIVAQSNNSDYVVAVDDTLSQAALANVISKFDEPVVVVKVSWISECVRKKRLVDVQGFLMQSPPEIKIDDTTVDPKSVQPESNAYTSRLLKNNRESLRDNDCDNEDYSDWTVATMATSTSRRPTINAKSFVCSRPSTSVTNNHNQHITEKLEALAATYKTTQDRWRAVGYERAIAVLKRHPTKIVTREEARSLPFIGERLADKIVEIVESGGLRKLDEVTTDEKVVAMRTFANVWGIGPTTAQLLVQRGYRTLDDLTKGNCLNRQQLIGLRHYDDLLERMPRNEAGEIERTVREASLAIDPNLVSVACGSYRRGKGHCGDVDVLVTHPDGQSHRGLLPRLVASLKQIGFLTDDLVAHEKNGAQHKYMGVCRLTGDRAKHRRLDIIVVPYSEFACCLLYFTGSAHFNRSMRLLARKMNMSLSEHSLNDGVIRNGHERLFEGTPLPTPTEQSIFEHLGLPYRPPEERDH